MSGFVELISGEEGYKLKKFIVLLAIIVLGLFMLGCGGTTPEIDEAAYTPQQPRKDAQDAEDITAGILEIVDLGCCATNIVVRETPLLGINSVTYKSDDFIMTLNSDRKVYAATDVINIWATLEYIGDYDAVEIWHGCPFMVFSISDGGRFNLGGITFDILDSSVLQRGRAYHFDYQKSGAWDGDAPDAEFWENFFREPDLMLPEGEYTIILRGSFKVLNRESGLVAELPITVTP